MAAVHGPAPRQSSPVGVPPLRLQGAEAWAERSIWLAGRVAALSGRQSPGDGHNLVAERWRSAADKGSRLLRGTPGVPRAVLAPDGKTRRPSGPKRSAGRWTEGYRGDTTPRRKLRGHTAAIINTSLPTALNAKRGVAGRPPPSIGTPGFAPDSKTLALNVGPRQGLAVGPGARRGGADAGFVPDGGVDARLLCRDGKTLGGAPVRQGHRLVGRGPEEGAFLPKAVPTSPTR